MAIPIVNVSQVREWENATWSAGISQEDVIRKAGGQVAYYAQKMTEEGNKILIIAGKGHNGDDAIQCGEQLRDREVKIIRVIDAAKAISEIKSILNQNYALVIDGLFGIGLNRQLDDKYCELINLINQIKAPKLAVDVPSGLNVETGETMGAVVQADATVTLGVVKKDMLRTGAAKYVGRLYVAPEIGLIPYKFKTDSFWTTADDFVGFPPARTVTNHKGSFGHLLIIAGSFGYHGAAVLAAKSAQKAQPGLITLLTTPDVYTPIASQLSQVMVNVWDPFFSIPEKTTAIMIGPGLASRGVSSGLTDFCRKIWDSFPFPVCIDASALDWLQEQKVNSSAPRIITPHPGEAARMLKISTEEVLSDRIGSLRKLSKRYGNCYVVLKGHQTIVGNSESEIFFNSSGNPHLAQGGAGDVLSGYLGGFIAQPLLQADILKTIRYAVWNHGFTADFLQKDFKRWTIEELISTLGCKINEKEIVFKF